MRNECQNIKILSSDSDNVKIKFIDSDIVMFISKTILKAKVSVGFYVVVKPTI